VKGLVHPSQPWSHMLSKLVVHSVVAAVALVTACDSASSDDCDCANGGVCDDAGVCDCAAGFSGDTCETLQTECGAITCTNGGVCVSDACSCADGYTGTACETTIRPKYLGAYEFSRTCAAGSTISGGTSVSAVSGDVAQVDLGEFGHGTAENIRGTLTGADTFTIPSQTLTRTSGTNKSPFTVLGTGTYNADGSIVATYTFGLADGTDTLNCTSTLTPQ
jgi:hypothetical protein